MIDNETLRGRMQQQLDVLGLTGERADQVVRELNFLACLLIEATQEGRLNG
jgi:thiamine pyrophosphokinase